MNKFKVKFLSALSAFVLTVAVTLGMVFIPAATTHQKITITDTAVIADAATNYYGSLNENLTGKAFRSSLASLITTTHTYQTSYSGLASIFPYSDVNPDNPNQILWFYTGTATTFTSFGSSTSSTNREHVWPKNAGNAFPASTETGSDAHHLRPCNEQLNSKRSNNNYDEVATTNGNIVPENGKTTYANLCYQANSAFYPGEGYRGATARILMYVQVRWGDKFNLKFVDYLSSNKEMGKISTLLKWHYLEPPTEEEIIRNNYVYSIQGNRNPFIDHPEYATKIFCYDGESYNTKLQSVAAQYDSYSGEISKDITSVSVTPSELTLSKGESATLSTEVTPSFATKDLIYTSSNTAIATVDTNGKVTGLSKGTAVITVAAKSDSTIYDTCTVTVKEVSGISVSGTPVKTQYVSGEEFCPDGITVYADYSDGTKKSVNPNDVNYYDGVTGYVTLSAGTTFVTASYGGFTAKIEGITVSNSGPKTITITRTSFENGNNYGWTDFTVSGISGKGYISANNSNEIQLSTSQSSYIICNTSPLKGGIVSVTVKAKANSQCEFEFLTSDKPLWVTVGAPTEANSHGTKTVTDSGTTWAIETTDKYFALVLTNEGTAYIESIKISYGTENNDETTLSDNAKAFKAYVIMAKNKTNAKDKFNSVVSALTAYKTLSEEEKVGLYADYQTLLQVIESYNNTAQNAEEESLKAANQAFKA